MKRFNYSYRALALDLTMLALPWLLASSEVLARAGGGSSGGSCHSWYCILLYPIVLINGAYISLRLSLKQSQVRRALAKMAEREPLWQEEGLIKGASSEFMVLQTAWGNQDLELIKQHLHPALYSNWESQINAQKVRGERNMMVGLSINKVRIVNVQNYKDNEKDEFTVAIDAKANDQTIVDGKITKEDNAKFREFWTFEWEQGHWKLREVVQANGWKRFVNAHIVYEQ